MATSQDSLCRPTLSHQADFGSGQSPTSMLDLPAPVLATVFSHAPEPRDLAAAFCACRYFSTAMASAPLRLCLGPKSTEHTKLVRRELDAQQLEVDWVKAALSGIRKQWPATEDLDLSGCPIADDDVASLLADLPRLDNLVLDSCQKLTSSAADSLARSASTGPHLVSLRRCYRLGPDAAAKLLEASNAAGSRLRGILLSHLDHLEFSDSYSPQGGEWGEGNGAKRITAKPTLARGPASAVAWAFGLRVVALHNCSNLREAELLTLPAVCPTLELLLLGGSGSGLGLVRFEGAPQVEVAAAAATLAQLADRLPLLRVLEITFFGVQAMHAIRSAIGHRVQVWDFSDEQSVLAAAEFAASLRGRKSPSMAYFMGRNWTFCSTPRRQEDRSLEKRRWRGLAGVRWAEDEGDLSELEERVDIGHSEKQDVWGWEAGVPSASKQFDRASHGSSTRSGSLTDAKWWEAVHEDRVVPVWGAGEEAAILMALKAAASCSDPQRRKTPLHIAGSRGDPEMAAGLLSLGAAAAGARDSGGATALFRAAEAGNDRVAEVLLKGGAEPLVGNRAGENPLYISALKGHLASVEAILAHCIANGIPWEEAHAYGDGWTPLMAAVVADRQVVGKVLLLAAGAPSSVFASKVGRIHAHPHDSSTMGTTCAGHAASSPRDSWPRDGLIRLLNAQNRYGQTALHIAARQDVVWFVERLLQAGASASIEDAKGMRALDVAVKEGHAEIQEILQAWEEVKPTLQPGVAPEAAQAPLQRTAFNHSPNGHLLQAASTPVNPLAPVRSPDPIAPGSPCKRAFHSKLSPHATPFVPAAALAVCNLSTPSLPSSEGLAFQQYWEQAPATSSLPPTPGGSFVHPGPNPSVAKTRPAGAFWRDRQHSLADQLPLTCREEVSGGNHPRDRYRTSERSLPSSNSGS